MMKRYIFSVAAALLFATIAVGSTRSEDTAASPETSPATDGTPERPKFVPLVDRPDSLIPLDKIDPIWVTPDRTQVVLGGEICLREGMLEFFACRTRSKEHESIVTLNIKPMLIHAALLLIGAKQGSPAKFNPVFVPPYGEKIDILVKWKDKDGTVKELPAREMIREVKSKRTMQTPWVFTGGLITTDPDGKKYYLADVSGEVFGVSNFPGAVLDVPFESSSNNEELYYEPNTAKIPDIGTPVTLMLRKYSENRDRN